MYASRQRSLAPLLFSAGRPQSEPSSRAAMTLPRLHVCRCHTFRPTHSRQTYRHKVEPSCNDSWKSQRDRGDCDSCDLQICFVRSVVSTDRSPSRLKVASVNPTEASIGMIDLPRESFLSRGKSSELLVQVYVTFCCPKNSAQRARIPTNG